MPEKRNPAPLAGSRAQGGDALKRAVPVTCDARGNQELDDEDCWQSLGKVIARIIKRLAAQLGVSLPKNPS